MSLKILLVPSLLAISLMLLIGFVKPDYSKWQAQRQALSQKESEAQNVQNVTANVTALNAFLDQNAEKEKFLLRYYPDNLDQGRLIDSFNFLASQSGVTLTAVSLNEVEQEQQEEGFGNVPFTSLQDGSAPADPNLADPNTLVPAQQLYQAPKPKAYEAQVTAQGDYGNLKSFLERIAAMDRLHRQKSFVIKRGESGGEQTAEGEAAVATGALNATYSGLFEFLPHQELASALQAPVFSQPTIDFTALDAAVARATATVPELGVASGGKANPFE